MTQKYKTKLFLDPLRGILEECAAFISTPFSWSIQSSCDLHRGHTMSYRLKYSAEEHTALMASTLGTWAK